MKAKAYLMQIQKLDTLITNKLTEVSQWRSIALNVTAKYSGECVKSSGSKQTMANAVDKIVDLNREINTIIDQLIETKQAVIKMIEQLNSTEYDILHKVYVQHLTLYEVAAACDKSYSWVTSVHGRALKNLQKILDSEV